MFIYQQLRSPDILMLEVIVVSFPVSLLLVTILNYMEIRHHPERFRKASLAICVGIAIATGLSALHNHIPLWQFGLSVYVGMAAGLAAFVVAPSKIRLDGLVRKLAGKAPIDEYEEYEEESPVQSRLCMPEMAKSVPLTGRTKTKAQRTEVGIAPRKINTTFNKQRLMAQILELSEEAERDGIPVGEIISALEDRQFSKTGRRRAF